jgi:hypothetical protein
LVKLAENFSCGRGFEMLHSWKAPDLTRKY